MAETVWTVQLKRPTDDNTLYTPYGRFRSCKAGPNFAPPFLAGRWTLYFWREMFENASFCLGHIAGSEKIAFLFLFLLGRKEAALFSPMNRNLNSLSFVFSVQASIHALLHRSHLTLLCVTKPFFIYSRMGSMADILTPADGQFPNWQFGSMRPALV